ncbi:sodium-dependent transporter [Pseudoclavibacter chungangensis]|uniref:Sodium-dependent transporter n=1 Tax=Pseudoclavibacter chungangensis TaxID=587635 RepID=A0A7J5C1M9_9MICO|nr:sodium-dependent transporter [Pseudoclavibacter chungangensis]KAB1662405.1 sodium-dependent transporter [Pseudoclavibacter chungangensis]NYJ68429.1 NSS family neurotransmitter:Na+ symporter [Pseudoclavibacter chungangensis]
MSTAPSTAAPPREQWTGQFGFIMSAIGSAVGLGNIWRFPGVAYENGGGAFLIPYLIALVTAGLPILFLDYALGHRFRGSAPTVFRRIGGRIGRFTESLGWFQVAIAFVIGLYYTAIIGWALSYFVFSFDLRWGDDPTSFLTDEYLQVSEPGLSTTFVPGVLIPLVFVWVAVIAVLAAGVKKGLERANVIAIPALGVAFLVLVVRALFLDGAVDGLNALFTPNWAALGDPSVWIAAYSQIFFSLSIAFGIMVTYSSYRKRRANLTTPGLVVAFTNCSFELLAGIGVFATLGFFAFQQGTTIDQLDGITGVGLSFMTFPAIVSQMPGGPLFGCLFFGSLVLAGFTSLISILQVVSAGVQEKFGLTSRSAPVVVGAVSAVLSILLFSTTTGLLALDVMDEWANNIGIEFSAVVVTVLVFWVLRRGRELEYHLNAVSTFKVGRIWLFFVAVLAPVLLTYMLYERIKDLVLDGYSDMPGWYLATFGWGTIVFCIIAAIVLTAFRWVRSPDEFTPWPPYPPTPTSSERTEAGA